MFIELVVGRGAVVVDVVCACALMAASPDSASAASIPENFIVMPSGNGNVDLDVVDYRATGSP
jgi:hypothetical protein